MSVIYTPPVANPPLYGLYSASTIIERTDPSRLADGVLVRSINCGPSGVWPLGWCESPDVEAQTVTLTGAAPTDTFTLGYNGESTAAIAANANAAAVDAALETLPNLDAVTVTGSPGAWVVEFTGNPGAQPLLTITPSAGSGSVARTTAGTSKEGERGGDLEFTGLVPWAVDDCGLMSDKTEQQARARQILRLQEQVRVEEAVADKLQAADVALPSSPGLVAAVGALDQQIASYGFAGVIHAAAHVAALAASLRLITVQGTSLLTPLGNRWAFGGGYADLGDTLYATGPTAVHRSPVAVLRGDEVRANQTKFVAEREVVVTWECFTVSTEVTA